VPVDSSPCVDAGEPRKEQDALNLAEREAGCAKFYSRSHHAVIRVYDDAGNVIETHEHKGDFKEP